MSVRAVVVPVRQRAGCVAAVLWQLFGAVDPCTGSRSGCVHVHTGLRLLFDHLQSVRSTSPSSAAPASPYRSSAYRSRAPAGTPYSSTLHWSAHRDCTSPPPCPPWYESPSSASFALTCAAASTSTVLTQLISLSISPLLSPRPLLLAQSRPALHCLPLSLTRAVKAAVGRVVL